MSEDKEMEEFRTVQMTDEETGEVTEFAILDYAQDGDSKYMLVIDVEQMDEDDPDAMILKEAEESDDELTYVFLEDGEEFDKAADLFAKNHGDYEIQIED